MRMLNVAVAAASLLTVAIAGPSFAFISNLSQERIPTAERVEVGNVDFRDAAQVQAFHKRLQQTALFVCGASADADRAQREANRACSEKVVRDAVSQLNRPLLTATYQQAGAPMVARGY